MSATLRPDALTMLVVGTNHRQSPVDFRERVAFVPDEVPGFLARARDALQTNDCFMLSTCNRTEFYAVQAGLASAADSVRSLLVEYKAIDPDRDAKHFYEYHGQNAIQQLFRVACGVDSQMLGEAQILQQVKDALDLAMRANALGVVGEHLLAAAIRCGNRARSETGISAGAMSVAFAAVSLAHKVFGDFTARSALVLGAGETGTLLARHLREHGIGRLWIANRTLDRARALGAEMRGDPVGLDQLPDVLPQVDIVLSSTGAPHHIVTAPMMRQAMRTRHNRTMLVVDIGVPRDFEPAVGEIDNVFLHDMDGLKTIIDQTFERRRREVPKVEAIIAHELQHFLDWYLGLQAAPVIKELRGHLEAMRAREIAKHASHLNPEQRQAVEQVTRSLLNKLMHKPTTLLREAATQGESGLRRIETARELFGLDATPDDEAE